MPSTQTQAQKRAKKAAAKHGTNGHATAAEPVPAPQPPDTATSVTDDAPSTPDVATSTVVAPASGDASQSSGDGGDKPAKRHYTKRSLAEKTAACITDAADGLKWSIETAKLWRTAKVTAGDEDGAAELSLAIEKMQASLASLVGVGDVLKNSAPATASKIGYEVGMLVRIRPRFRPRFVNLVENPACLDNLTISKLDEKTNFVTLRSGEGDKFVCRRQEIQSCDEPVEVDETPASGEEPAPAPETAAAT